MKQNHTAFEARLSPSGVAATAVAFALCLYIAWIGAWLLGRWLESHVDWMATNGARSCYWLVMKLVLWIVPALVLMPLTGRSLREAIGLGRVREIVLWGGGVGIILGVITAIVKTLGHQPLFASPMGWPLFGGVLVAPIVEEITFRGAILGALETRFRFWLANGITALLFVGVHLPGWYFQGRLMTNLMDPLGGALSIFLLGIVFGHVVHRSKSVAAGTLTHVLNNLFNA